MKKAIIVIIIIFLVVGYCSKKDKKYINDKEGYQNITLFDNTDRTWVKDKDKYYAINDTGKAIFSINTTNVEKVNPFINNYSIVENKSFKESIYSKEGKEVFNEENSHYSISSPISKNGYIIVNEMNHYYILELSSNKITIDLGERNDLSNDSIIWLGSDIFYSNNLGIYSIKSKTPLELNNPVNPIINISNLTDFINDKAIYYGTDGVYVIDALGNHKKIINHWTLTPFMRNELGEVKNDTYNGYSFYYDNKYYNLNGNIIMNPSEKLIKCYKQVGELFLVQTINGITLLDKNGKEIFTPIKVDIKYSVDINNNYLLVNNTIYNLKGKVKLKATNYGNNSLFYLRNNTIIVINGINNNIEFYLDYKLKKIKPYWNSDIKEVSKSNKTIINNNEKVPTPKDNTPIVPTPEYTEVLEINGLKLGKYTLQITGTTRTMTFNSDYTVKMDYQDENIKGYLLGTFKVEGNQVYVTWKSYYNYYRYSFDMEPIIEKDFGGEHESNCPDIYKIYSDKISTIATDCFAYDSEYEFYYYIGK